MKKVIMFLIFVISILFIFSKDDDLVFANTLDNDLNEEVNVYIFKGEGCGFCARALEFFRSIENEYGKYFNLVEYEIWYDDNNYDLFQKVSSYFNETFNGVPVIIVGKERFHGFDESYTGDIKKAIMNEYNKSNDVRFDIMDQFDRELYNAESTYSRFALINNSVKQLILNLSSIFAKIKL